MTLKSPAAVSARRARIEQWTREGRSASEIAAFLGIAKRSVVRIRSELGIAQPTAGLPMGADELRIAADLLADGCSYQEVARTVGRSVSTLQKRFPGQGWSRHEIGEYTAARRRFNLEMTA